jgi:hypothetical protein
MIKHVVMWKVSDANGSKAENIEKIRAALESMRDRVKALESLYVGVNFSTRPVAFDVVLITEHLSKEALESYQNDPYHKEVAGIINQVREVTAVVDSVIP